MKDKWRVNGEVRKRGRGKKDMECERKCGERGEGLARRKEREVRSKSAHQHADS